MPCFPVRHGHFRQTGQQVAVQLHFFEKLVPALERPVVARGFGDREIETVDLLPHFRRNDFPHLARILPCRPQARNYRVRIVEVECQETDHVFGARLAVTAFKNLAVAGDRDQWFPLALGIDRQIEHQM